MPVPPMHDPGAVVEQAAPAEAWDSKAIGRPAILVTPESYWMWYPGIDSRAQYALGLALSVDGVTWTRAGDEPVLVASSLNNDLHSILDPVVVKAGDRLLLWAATQGRRAETTLWQFWSTNGVDWQPAERNPVLDPLDGATWEQCGLARPTVVFDGRRWHLWYVGGAACPALTGIGHAISDDGRAWTRVSAQPEFRSSDRAWDLGEVTDPWIVYHGETFHLWYAGSGVDRRSRIGYAISRDGAHWERQGEGPVLAPDPGTSLETGGVFAPVVARVNDRWMLWYSSVDRAADGFRGVLNLATSTDGMTWIRCPRNPVFRPSPHGFYLNPS